VLVLGLLAECGTVGGCCTCLSDGMPPVDANIAFAAANPAGDGMSAGAAGLAPVAAPDASDAFCLLDIPPVDENIAFAAANPAGDGMSAGAAGLAPLSVPAAPAAGCCCCPRESVLPCLPMR